MDILMYTPIILLVVVVVLVWLIGKYVTGRKSGKVQQVPYAKRVKRVVGAYVLLLILSVGVFYLLPDKTGSLAEEQAEAPDHQDPFSLYDAASQGDVSDIDKDYIKEEWEFSTDENAIAITAPDVNQIPIVVEKKQANDDKIEARFYQTEMYAHGASIDVSGYAKPVQIEQTDQELTIIQPDPDEHQVELSAFKQEFPIMQFTNETWMSDDSPLSGEQLLYLQMPEDIKVDDSDAALDYVGELE